MDWKDKMEKAMKAMKEACKEISWDNCCHCPFFVYCNAMGHEGLSAPDIWEIKEDEN